MPTFQSGHPAGPHHAADLPHAGELTSGSARIDEPTRDLDLDVGTAAVAELLARAAGDLARAGVTMSTLRLRSGCAVLQATSAARAQAGDVTGCHAVRRELAALCEHVGMETPSLIETSCEVTGDEACIFALSWDGVSGPPPAASSSQPAPVYAVASRTNTAVAALQPTVQPTVRAPANAAGSDVRSFVVGARREDTGLAKLPRWPWLRRRAWLILVPTVVAAASSWWVQRSLPERYSATSVMLVLSGASYQGPGGANEADTLAATYAALIPSDSAIKNAVSVAAGVPVSVAGRDLSVVVERSTALMEATFTAATPSRAIAGARALVDAVAGGDPSTPAIAAGSVALVHVATAATRSGGVAKDALPIGILLGLLLGGGLAVTAERADPRIDSAADLAAASGSPAVELQGGDPPPELDAAFGGPRGTIVLAPLNRRALRGAHALALGVARSSTATVHFEAAEGVLAPGALGERASMVLAAPLDSAGGLRSAIEDPGRIVLAAAAGERLRTVASTREKLAVAGRLPTLAVLVAPPKHTLWAEAARAVGRGRR